MKILTVADEESRLLWDYWDPSMLQDIDLILSAGDLSQEYLSFLVTMTNVPVLYVHGNHDGAYDQQPPEGCICIDDQLYIHEGIRILGLGGSMLYNQGSYQYSEKAMRGRMRKLMIPLYIHRGFDILLTHAPSKGFHDGKDLPHQGFDTFTKLIERFQPAYHVHGHIHKNYGCDFFREDMLYTTKVVNAFEKHIIEI